MRRWPSAMTWSVALLMATCGCVLAVRSRAQTDLVGMLAGGRVQYAASHHGRIGFWFSQYRPSDRRSWGVVVDSTTPAVYEQQLHLSDGPSARVHKWRGCGVSWGQMVIGQMWTEPYLSVELPHWVFTLPAFWLGARWYRGQLRRAARREQGCCIECGYDLRGNSTAERCSECGAAIVARAPTAGVMALE